jgi:hypothetical protein
MHTWDGCKCSKCGKARDEGHDWSKDCEKCARCGLARRGAHAWRGCTCSQCGQVSHAWGGCKCTACGKVRDEGHAWGGCKCTACGKVRDEGHAWEGDTCNVCGRSKSKAQLWADQQAMAGNYADLAILVGQYNHELNEQDQQRRQYAFAALLAAGDAAVDAVAGVITREGVAHGDLARILMASGSKRAAGPLMSKFHDMSIASDESNAIIRFLADTKAVEVAPQLVKLLKAKYWGERGLAARALSVLQVPETVDALLEAMQGDPTISSGLRAADTPFARQVQRTFEERRRASGPRFDSMAEADMLQIMQKYANAYNRDDAKTIDELEYSITDIGRELYRRGGEAAMRRMLDHFTGSTARHIERAWSGIGSWLG